MIFNIDMFYGDDTSIWANFWITFFGTLFGFLLAILLNKWTEQKQIKNEKRKLLRQHRDRLFYFVELITSTLKLVDQQLKNFNELSTYIDKEPYEQHLLKMVPLNDITRLQNMDSQGIFQSFYEIYNDQKENKDYKNLYSTIDYLSIRLTQAIDSNEKHVQFVYRDQFFIKEKVDALANAMYLLIDRDISEPISPPLHNLLRKYLNIYLKLTAQQASLNSYSEDIIKPILRELEPFKNVNSIATIFELLQSARLRFEHMKRNGVKFANEIGAELITEMKSPIKTLTEINDRITKSIKSFDERNSE